MLHNIELLSDEYIWSHRNVTAPFRFGPPSGILVATGRLAAAVRRLSAKIEDTAAWGAWTRRRRTGRVCRSTDR